MRFFVLIKYFAILGLVIAFSGAPCLAQGTTYDMSAFDANRNSAGASQFRITPDMYPKHSYQRLKLMRMYGPKGKAIGLTKIKGKAFNYMNPETLKDQRNKAKATDMYIDNAYDAPDVDKSYDPAYSSGRKSFSNQLKPLGSKHSQAENPFNNSAKNTYNYNKPFNSNSYKNKFNTTDSDKSYLNPKVFDDESMF